jgi:hypothetical protein
MSRLFSPPWACATDIANSESEAEIIAAMAALRMFNIVNSPLEVIAAPGPRSRRRFDIQATSAEETGQGHDLFRAMKFS